MQGAKTGGVRLLALEASESSYFCGQDDDKFFSCDVPAVRV